VSLGIDFRVDIRPYSGFTDPGLPVASWISQAGGAGDASGGQLDFGFFFQLDGQPLISELFNLEQISIDTTSGTSADCLLETVNMDNLALNRPGSTQQWMFKSAGGTGLGGRSAYDGFSNVLPLWLGSPNRDEGDSGLRMTFDNVDLLLVAVTLQGYMWGPRAVLAEGGPRRPVGGGLFGA